MKQKILSLFALLMLCVTASAECPDFTNLNSPFVTAFAGLTKNPFATQGVINGRHTLITQQGTDPNTDNKLNLLPAGESQVIRLGNEKIGAEAEALTYRFTVDVNNAVLLLKFAVVFEDPGHPHVAQPRFVVRVTDSDGNLTEECAEYDVSAAAEIPGFQTYQRNSAQAIRWRDWTNVGLDLSKYIGQTVQVQFITYDCDYSGHFGYAYFTASCMPNLLQLNCGTPFEVSAPEGFASYLWDNGDQTRTTSRTETNSGHIWCKITSDTGCQFTLNGYVTASPITMPASIQETICEGDSYSENHFELPPQSPGVHKYYNTFINPAACSTQTTELELNVIQRYNYFNVSICHGEDYTENGFNIIQPAVGVRRDTLSVGNVAGCEEYNVLELTVNTSFEMPDIIVGETAPCTGEIFTYSFANSETQTKFEWEFPGNVAVTKGMRTSQVSVYFTNDTPATIVLKGENGCGTGSTSLLVEPRQTYDIQLSEDICQGEVFDKYDFNLGVQNTVGYFVHSKHLESSLGCDSIVTLALNVLPTPVVRIEPKDAVLCNPGEEITLWALTDDMEYANPDDKNPHIPCGDYDNWYDTQTQSNPNDFGGNVSSNEFQLRSYNGTDKIVVIPSQINGAAMIYIYGDVFSGDKNQNATDIIIPPTVKGIAGLGNGTFSGSSLLAYVTIPKSVTGIATNAFSNSPNVTIRCFENSYAHQYAIDYGVKFDLIEECGKQNESDMLCGDYDEWYNTLTPSDVNASFISGGEVTITTCASWGDTRYVIPHSHFPGGGLGGTVVSICTFSGRYGNKTEFIIPSSVHTIDCSSFSHSAQLTNIVVPESVTTISGGSFLNSPNLVIHCYENSVVHQYAIDNNIEFKLIKECAAPCVEFDYKEWYDSLTHSNENDFGGSVNFTTWVISQYNGPDTKMVIPSPMYSYTTLRIGNNAFANRPNLTEAVIPESVDGILAGAFSNNNALTYVAIPKTINNISSTAFDNSPNVIIRCYEDSYAHQYAVNNGIKFEFFQKDCSGNDEFPSVTIYDCTLNYLWNTGSTEGAITVKPTQTTEYDVLVTTQNGCSAMAKQTVVVNTTQPVVVDATICKGETWSGYGITETETGVYQTSIKAENCDIPVTINLTVNEPAEFVIEENVCAGERFTEHGFDIVLYQEGLFEETFNFIGKNGCDSLVVLRLNVNPSEEKILRDNICQNLPYNKNGFNLPVQEIAGEFTHAQTGTTAQGCHSETTLHLTVNPVITNIISDEVNFGEAYNKYNFSFPKVIEDMTETKNEKSTADCDSIVTLNLRVKFPSCPPQYETVSEIICENDLPFAWRDTTFLAGTTGKDYVFNRKNTVGCDSIVTLHLTVNPVIKTVINDDVNIGEAYNKYNFSLPKVTQDLTQTQNLKSAAGCDSIVTLNLRVICPAEYETVSHSICESDLPFVWRDITFAKDTQSGDYVFNRKNVLGCDSIVTLNLNVMPTDYTTLEATILDTESYLFAGQQLNQPGTYTDRRKNIHGCDSIITLNLRMQAFDVTPPDTFTPNGDGKNDVFEIPNLERFPKNSIVIFNRWGNKVFEASPYRNDWDGRNHFGLRVGGDLLPAGTYFYILDWGDGSKPHKGYVYISRE